MDHRDVNKLPKWAQARIYVLERDLEDAREALEAGPESDTYADPFGTLRPLGVGTTVRFVLTTREDGSPGDYVDVRREEDRVSLHGSTSLVLYPRTSNAVYVKLEHF